MTAKIPRTIQFVPSPLRAHRELLYQLAGHRNMPEAKEGSVACSHASCVFLAPPWELSTPSGMISEHCAACICIDDDPFLQQY